MSHDGIDFKLLVGQDIPTRSYKAGEIIFREGDPATELFIIKEGRVDILSGNRLLDSIDGNGIFGEMALIDAAPRERKCRCCFGRYSGPDFRKAIPISCESNAVFCA